VKRIKVLYISQSAGGVQRHIGYLAKHLPKDRFDVCGCFPPRDRVKGANPHKENFFDLFNRLGLRVIPLEMCREIRPIEDFRAFLKLLRILKQEKWDIVHTHSSKAGFLGRIAAKMSGIPVIIHTPNAFAFDRPPQSFLNFYYILLERLAGYFCDALISVSPSEGDLARKTRVVPPEKIVQISNGIDLGEFAQPIEARQKKRSLGLPEDQPMVAMIGRFAPQKAPGVFIDAVKRIVSGRKEVTCIMVGDGPLLQKTKERVIREGLEKHLFLFNWRADAREILASCDVYVLSSLWEGLPYTVLEAMALSKPVVATAARGTRDVVVDGVTGFLVGLRDDREMAEKVLSLLSDPARCRRMGEAGRRRVEEVFSLSDHIRKTAALYERLCAERAPR